MIYFHFLIEPLTLFFSLNTKLNRKGIIYINSNRKKNDYYMCKNNISLSEIITDYGIKLVKKGKTYSALCPFHIENTPSFYVNDIKGVYHCFGCGVSGNIETFIKKKKINLNNKNFLLNNTFYTRNLSRKYIENSHLGSFTILILIQIAGKYYEKLLGVSKVAKIYFYTRGISSLTAKIYKLGYSSSNREILSKLFQNYGFNKEQIIETGLVNKHSGILCDIFQNRLVIPILNKKGIIIGFGGRSVNNLDLPKYLNSSDNPIFKKGRCLFSDYNFSNFNKLKPKIGILVEGYMDCIILMQNGIRFSLASLGTGINKYHLKRSSFLTKNNHVVFSLDNDQAGEKAAKKSFLTLAEKIKENQLKISISSIPLSYCFKDPDELSYYKGGCFYIKEIINNSVPGFLWIDNLICKFNPDISLYFNQIFSESIIVLLHLFGNKEIDSMTRKFFMGILKNDSKFESEINFFFSRNVLELLIISNNSNQSKAKKILYFLMKNKKKDHFYNSYIEKNASSTLENKLIFFSFFFQVLNEDINQDLLNCYYNFSSYSRFIFQKYQNIFQIDNQKITYQYYWKHIYSKKIQNEILLQNTARFFKRNFDFQRKLFEVNITNKTLDGLSKEFIIVNLYSNKSKIANNLGKIEFKKNRLVECLLPKLNDFYDQSKKKLIIFQEKKKKKIVLINQIDKQIDLLKKKNISH